MNPLFRKKIIILSKNLFVTQRPRRVLWVGSLCCTLLGHILDDLWPPGQHFMFAKLYLIKRQRHCWFTSHLSGMTYILKTWYRKNYSMYGNFCPSHWLKFWVRLFHIIGYHGPVGINNRLNVCLRNLLVTRCLRRALSELDRVQGRNLPTMLCTSEAMTSCDVHVFPSLNSV